MEEDLVRTDVSLWRFPRDDYIVRSILEFDGRPAVFDNVRRRRNGGGKKNFAALVNAAREHLFRIQGVVSTNVMLPDKEQEPSLATLHWHILAKIISYLRPSDFVV